MKNVILVLQGGGALGAFQCGAYRQLSAHFKEHQYRLIAVVGSSIGAVNASLIARHWSQADGGAGALESFWRKTMAAPSYPFFPPVSPHLNSWNGFMTGMLMGNPAIFSPNYGNWNPMSESRRFREPLYDTARAERTLSEHLGTFPENQGSWPLLGVRAMDVAGGSPVLFHSWKENVTPDHVRASLSVPLLFPSVEIDSIHYWDGDFWPMTALPDVLNALRGNKGLDSALAVTIENYSRPGNLPESALECSYRLFATTLGERAEHEDRWTESTNRYKDFVEELGKLAHDSPKGALKNRIEREQAHMDSEGLLRLRSVRISRANLPNDHVSRDLDYSPERIDLLIDQGALAADTALRELKDRAPSAARPKGEARALI